MTLKPHEKLPMRRYVIGKIAYQVFYRRTADEALETAKQMHHDEWDSDDVRFEVDSCEIIPDYKENE